MTVAEAKAFVLKHKPDARAKYAGGSRIDPGQRWRIFLCPGGFDRFHSKTEGQAWKAAAAEIRAGEGGAES